MADYDVFSKLTNELFYVKVGEDENGKGKYSHEESILYKTKYDDKVILILHELYINTNFRRKCLITLDYLIEKCGYKVDKDNRKSFKNILEKLKELNLINFSEINKSNELILINTEEVILQARDYTQLADEEVVIFNNVADVRKRTTLLKLYLYLKARTTKRGNSDSTGKTRDIQVEFVPQTTYQSYETINKYTNISESRIKEYIDMLQAMNLITYVSVGKRYKQTDKQQKLTEAPNVYAINILQDDIQAELELGVKRCKYDQQKQGYVIVDREYKNNNRKIYGKKGSLTKKLNNGSITEEEQKQYDDICKMQNEYKDTYENFTLKIEQDKQKYKEEKPDRKGIGRQLAKEGINPFTNKPYEKEKYTSYEDYIDSLL